MKPALFFYGIVCLFLLSCKKEHSSNNITSSKKYPVSFKLAGFSQQVLGSKANTHSLSTNLPSYLTKLEYFASDGHSTTHITEDSTSSNFGFIADSLAPGTYNIVIITGQYGLNTLIYNGFDYKNLGYLNYQIIPGQKAVPWGDTFVKNFNITVTNAPVTQTVTLDRIVGKLEINLLDVLPNNAKTIIVTTSTELNYYNYSNRGPLDDRQNWLVNPVTTHATIIPSTALNKSGFKVDNIIAQTTSSFSVNIVCSDAAGKVLAQKTVNNVSCQKDKVTILTGSIFAIDNTFQITANSTWDNVTVHF
jgi:hypothetical protein